MKNLKEFDPAISSDFSSEKQHQTTNPLHPSMTVSNALLSDIDEVLALHYRYHVDSISEEDKQDGFITTAFSAEELTELIEKEQGLFVARKEGKIVAYVMSASWQFCSRWPMFRFMIDELPKVPFNGITLNTDNSYQYGPVCVDKTVRGTGVLEAIFQFALNEMSTRFEYLITFVNKTNPRSFEAHKRKLGLEVINEFKYNNNHYYKFACSTKI